MSVLDLKIQRTLLEITNSDVLTHKEDENHLSRIIKTALPKILEELFSTSSKTNTTIEIPKVEINLGPLSRPLEETAVTNLLRAKLKIYFDKIIEQIPEETITTTENAELSVKSTDQKTEIDVLIYYLENGYLPWYAKSLPKGNHFNDNHFIIQISNYIANTGGEKAIKRLLNLYEFKDLDKFTSGLVSPNYKKELERIIDINSSLLKENSSFFYKLAKVVYQQIISELIRSSGQISQVKSFYMTLLTTFPDSSQTFEKGAISKLETASVNEISLIIAETLKENKKNNYPDATTDNSIQSIARIKQAILHFLLNRSLPTNLDGITQDEFYRYLKLFFLSDGKEISKIYKISNVRKSGLIDILSGLQDIHLKSIFQYYFQQNSGNNLQLNNFINVINESPVLTERDKLISAKLILDKLVNNKSEINTLTNPPILQNTDKLAEYENTLINEGELITPLSAVYFNDLLKFIFENGFWPWWIDNYKRVYGQLSHDDPDKGILSVLDNYQKIYPLAFADFTQTILRSPNKVLKTFANLPWPLAKKIINTAVPGIKNTFSDTVASIFILVNQNFQVNFLDHLAAQQYLYKILRDGNLPGLGFVELINLLLIQIAQQLSIPLWRIYSLISRNYQDLNLPTPLSKEDVDSIFIYHQEREDQFVKQKQQITDRKDSPYFDLTATEFISETHEEIILSFVKGHQANLALFPTSFALGEFIVERLKNSNLFLTKLSELVLAHKNKALFKIIELEEITGLSLIETLLNKRENKIVLQTLSSLLRNLQVEKGILLNQIIRISIINEQIWDRDSFSKKHLKQLLHRLAINLNVNEGILEAAVAFTISESSAEFSELHALLTIDKVQLLKKNTDNSLVIYSKIEYGRELINKLFNFEKANYTKVEIQLLLSDISEIKNPTDIESWISTFNDADLRTLTVTYVNKLNEAEFAYFINNILRALREKEESFLENILKTVDSITQSSPTSVLIPDITVLLAELFESLKNNFSRKEIEDLYTSFNQLKNKQDIKEWITSLTRQANGPKLTAYLEAATQQEIQKFSDAINLIFKKILETKDSSLSLKDEKNRSWLLDFIESKISSSTFKTFTAILSEQKDDYLPDLSDVLNQLNNSDLSLVLTNILSGKMTTEVFLQLINLDKNAELKTKLEFWKNELDFTSEFLSSKIESAGSLKFPGRDSREASIYEPIKDVTRNGLYQSLENRDDSLIKSSGIDPTNENQFIAEKPIDEASLLADQKDRSPKTSNISVIRDDEKDSFDRSNLLSGEEKPNSEQSHPSDAEEMKHFDRNHPSSAETKDDFERKNSSNVESKTNFERKNPSSDDEIENFGRKKLSKAEEIVNYDTSPPSNAQDKVNPERKNPSRDDAQDNFSSRIPLSRDFKEVEALRELDLYSSISSLTTPHSIAEILSYLLMYFELPWWSPIKDLKEFERLVKSYSLEDNESFRQGIIKFATPNPENLSQIIEQIDRLTATDLNTAHQKSELEKLLQNDLDFLTEFIASKESLNKLEPYLNKIIADFKTTNSHKIKERFRKVVLTTLLSVDQETEVLLDNFLRKSSNTLASEYTKAVMELRLLNEIKRKEVDSVLAFLTKLETEISVGSLNSDLSISQNVINLYNRADKISVPQLLQDWLRSIETIKQLDAREIKRQIIKLEQEQQIDTSLYVARELLEIAHREEPNQTLIRLPYLSFINMIDLTLSRITGLSNSAKKASINYLGTLLIVEDTPGNLALNFNLFCTLLFQEGIQKDEINTVLIRLKNEITDSNLNYILENISFLMTPEARVDSYAIVTNQDTKTPISPDQDLLRLSNTFLEQLKAHTEVLSNLVKSGNPNRNQSGSPLQKEHIKQRRELDVNLDERIYIPNAGLVILWPFLSRLFSNLNYTEKGKFLSQEKRLRAIYLSQYLIGFTEDNPEYTLMLNKLLCGMELSEPIEEVVQLTDQEKAETRSLISSVLAQWKEMNNTSIENFQKTFLQREGVMFKTGENWNIVVGKSTFDVLLMRLPWGLSIIKYSWNNYLIFVEWKAMS